MESFKDICHRVGLLARTVGRDLTEKRNAGFGIEAKGHNDFVTDLDRYSERCLVAGLESILPQAGFIAEEGTRSQQAEHLNWIVDPIDGTTNFKSGLPYFAISIGVKHHGETVVGVVFAPRLDELYTAVKGEGAMLNGEPIHCSQCTALSQAVVCTGFPYDKAENADNNIAEAVRVIPRVRGFRRMGSASLDICYAAMGVFDAFWELNLHVWDVCAAYLIAAESGCEIHSLRENRGESVLIAPQALVAPMLELLAPEV